MRRSTGQGSGRSPNSCSPTCSSSLVRPFLRAAPISVFSVTSPAKRRARRRASHPFPMRVQPTCGTRQKRRFRTAGSTGSGMRTATVISLSSLQTMYFHTVGMNTTLSVNVPPAATGQFDTADVELLQQFGGWYASAFKTNLAHGQPASADSTWSTGGFDATRAIDDDVCTYWAAASGTTSARLEVTPASGRGLQHHQHPGTDRARESVRPRTTSKSNRMGRGIAAPWTRLARSSRAAS